MLKQEKFDAKIVQNPMTRRPNWQESQSPYGYSLAEVASAIIKEVRRGKDKEAAFWAHQLAISGEQSQRFLWDILLTCSIEDVGLANPLALQIVSDAERVFFRFEPGYEARHLAVCYAAMYLARSEKSR